MKKIVGILAVLIQLITGAQVFSQDASREKKASISSSVVRVSPNCGALHFAGITLGITTDSEVQRLLGTGISRDEIDASSRYFVDPKASATLHVKSCTDLIVCEVTVQEGIAIKPTEVGEATSKWFNPLENFGNWPRLHLGSTKDEVRKSLGDPVNGNTTDSCQYDSACACELPVFFTVYFKNNRIHKVVFSAPSD